MPYFSIIIPTYNRGWILGKTIQQIQNQSFTNWELIVVDDGSTDNTRETVLQFAEQDKRIKYIYQTNARQAAARQKGLENTNGTWITYMDSDDEIYPDYLQTAYTYFAGHPQILYAFAYCDRTLELHDKNHNLLTAIDDPATKLPLDSITLQSYAHWLIKPCGTGIFQHKDTIPDAAWDTSFKLIEDIDFIFQLGLKYPKQFGFIQKPLFHQRQVFGNDGLCSNASYNDWADAFEKIFKKYEHTWLMEGQSWYPSKVKKYREKQKLFEQGLLPPAYQRYFPDYF